MASIMDRFAAMLGYARKGAARRNGFAAADMSRLTASLASETEFINTTLRYQLRRLRARSRQACQNNPYGRRFAQLVVDNVCGPQPFRLQAKAAYANGTLDVSANRRIEAEWRAWGRVGACEITGKWSWNTLQRLIVRSLAVDGEVLIRKLAGPEQGRHGIRLQLVDIDRLDEQHNKVLSGGGAIHMGVEVDGVGRAVAYHLLKRKPSQWVHGHFEREYERIPAAEVIHLYIPESAEQVRGVPWIYAALLQLVHLGAFAEAAVIAGQVGASQMGFIQSPDGGDPDGDGKDVNGNPMIDIEPGSFHRLDPGWEVKDWSPNYPDAQVGPFIKAVLRGISAGLGVAYHNLASDLEGVNYSSARIGELDERDGWMAMQQFVVEHMHEPFYADTWLPMQSLSGVLPFPMQRLDKYRAVHWQGRRWTWVDPLKEVNAAVIAIDKKLKSRTRIVAEQGDDFEDTLNEIAAEQDLAEAVGVSLAPQPAAAPAVAPTGADPAADDPADDDNPDAAAAAAKAA